MLPFDETVSTVSTPKSVSVSSADLARRFGQLRQMHPDDAIVVTHHGRPTHVLTTVAHYDSLRQAPAGDGASQSAIDAVQRFADCLRNGVLQIDYEMTVLVANQVAHVMVDQADRSLVGQKIFDAVPTLRRSLVGTYVRRAVASKEPCTAELPSLFRPGNWIRVDVHPYARHVTILFQDITDDVQRHRMGDRREAIRAAVEGHDGVGYACVNTRGHIEQVDASFSGLIQLPAERLRHVAVADLVPVAHRVAFRQALDTVLSEGGTGAIDTVLLDNEGQAVPVRVAMSEMHGSYGSEGAVLLLTRR